MFLPDPTGKKRSRKKIALWTLVLALLIAGGFGAKPLYHWLKQQRSGNMVEQAEQLMKEEKWQDAFNLLQAALQMNPRDLQANRVMAQLLTAANREEAFDFWNILFSQGVATPEDRVRVIQLAIARNRFDLADKLLAEALQETPPRPEALRAAAVLADAVNNTPMAVQYARLSLRASPDDSFIRFLLARHLLRSGQPQELEEAKALLWALIKEQPANAAAPIQVLASAPNLHKTELAELLRVVRSASSKTNNLAVLELALATRLNPEEHDKLVEKAAADAQSTDRLIVLARWLNQRREFDKTLEVLKLEDALKTNDLFLVYADAVAGAGKWLDLEEVFSRKDLPIEPVLAELYRARISTELNQLTKAKAHWDRVHLEAAAKQELLWYVAEYAERTGEQAQATRAYRQLMKDPVQARKAFSALLRMAETQGDVRELRKLVQEMVELYPNDNAPKSDLAYLNLLLEEQVSRSKSVAEELVAANPNLLAYRTTLALALLRSGEITAAKKVYEPISFEWNTALPAWQAVYVAVMGAAGEQEVARKLAPTIPANRLKGPELELIQPWL